MDQTLNPSGGDVLLHAMESPGQVVPYLAVLVTFSIRPLVVSESRLEFRGPVVQGEYNPLLGLHFQRHIAAEGAIESVYTVDWASLQMFYQLTKADFESYVLSRKNFNEELFSVREFQLETLSRHSLVQYPAQAAAVLGSFDRFFAELGRLFTPAVVEGLAGFLPVVGAPDDQLDRFVLTHMCVVETKRGCVYLPNMRVLREQFGLHTLNFDFIYYMSKYPTHLYLGTRDADDFFWSNWVGWLICVFEFKFTVEAGLVFSVKSSRFLREADRRRMAQTMNAVGDGYRLTAWTLGSLGVTEGMLHHELLIAQDMLERLAVLEDTIYSREKIMADGFVPDLFRGVAFPPGFEPDGRIFVVDSSNMPRVNDEYQPKAIEWGELEEEVVECKSWWETLADWVGLSTCCGARPGKSGNPVTRGA